MSGRLVGRSPWEPAWSGLWLSRLASAVLLLLAISPVNQSAIAQESEVPTMSEAEAV